MPKRVTMSSEFMNTFNEYDNIAKKFTDKNNVFEYIEPDRSKWVLNDDGIIRSKPNISIRSKKIKLSESIKERAAEGQVIFECIYTFNDLGFRKNSFCNSSEKAFFFGDSMVIGEGCADKESLPELFQNKNTQYQVINFGFFGTGPVQMYKILTHKKYRKLFKDKKGKVIYAFKDDAIKISVGKASWAKGYPKVKIIDDKIVFDGSFETQHKGEFVTSNLTIEDCEFTVKILNACKKEINRLSKDLEFEILISPLIFTPLLGLCDFLDDYKISYYNLSLMDIFVNPYKQVLFLDGHFTKTAYELIINRMHLYKQFNIKCSSYHEELEMYAYTLPSHPHFPLDDVSVISSLLIKKWGVRDNSAIDFFKDVYLLKKDIINNIRKRHFCRISDLKNAYPFLNDKVLRIYEKEYFQGQ